MTSRPAAVAFIMLLAPALAGAQSLGEAAARERDRRARQSPGAPAYDDYDLQKGKPPSPSPSPSPSPAVRAATPVPVPVPIPGTAGGVAPPRGRGPRNPVQRPSPGATPPAVAPTPAAPTGPTAPAATATATPPPAPAAPVGPPEAAEGYWRARAQSLRDAVKNAERQVSELEARVNALRNDMAPANAMQANREQNRQASLGQAIADLEQARAGLARARQALDDLEEEARRKGALPGWLRER